VVLEGLTQRRERAASAGAKWIAFCAPSRHRADISMSEFDPTELIALCDSILDFGEVTENEAYNLADWLNKHDEACLLWPGEDLVRPLQEIWADGKVTRTELRRLTGLLRSIHKEWTKIQFDESMKQAHLRVQDLARHMPPTEPKLPPIGLTLPIKSHTQRDVRYNVDLSGPSCTCPDWRGCRADLPLGHLTRCCKHAFDAYSQIIPRGLWSGWIGAYVASGWTVNPKTEWSLISIDGAIWLVSTPAGGDEWMNFYAEENGSYERFGYNLTQERWSYAIEPPSANKLLRLAVTKRSAI